MVDSLPRLVLMPRRFLIAPDKFKGSLSASEAADAMACGIRRVFPDAEIDLCPIADGGEGFMEALHLSLGGTWIHCPAVDPLGRPMDSRYVLAETAHGLTAILEMAETAGLWRLSPDEQNPLHTTTRGTGMQIAHAVTTHRVERILLGLGGSATNDGGSGMADALGVDFLMEDGNRVAPLPSNLRTICTVDPGGRMPLPEIIAACDVDHPLLGPRGATAVFSRQKGAGEQDQTILEDALLHLTKISGGASAAETPGAGAAGGLGFGLLHFTQAKLVPGFTLLAEFLNLESRIRAADHVLTGEGSLDHQSLGGKGPVALARMAAARGVPVTGFCGISDTAIQQSKLFQSIHSLHDTGLPLETLIRDASRQLTECVVRSQS
jgi:glycerate kinase